MTPRPESDLVLLDRPSPGVVLVTLNRPHRRNALSRALLARLVAVFGALRTDVADGELRAVVLTGAGSAFCAGLDLAEVEEQGVPDVLSTDVVGAIAGLGVPVIGAINGPAVTGGLEIALACDFRIAGEGARFADTHSRVGVVPGWGLTARLPLVVGGGWARQMSATGAYVDAALAERIGLVNSVVPAADLIPTALALAATVTEVDPGVLGEIRRLYDAGERDGARAALDGERTVWASAGALRDEGAFAARTEAVMRHGRSQVGD